MTSISHIYSDVDMRSVANILNFKGKDENGWQQDLHISDRYLEKLVD